MNSPLVISQSEFQQCEVQFITLKPVDGFLNGDQARSFFLQSGLPPPVLGQIWQLADLTRDGKLDALEFSIAMKLIRNTRANIPLPAVLPDSLKRIEPPQAMPIMRPPAYGMPQMMSAPMYLPGQIPPAPPIQQSTFAMGTKELCDWNIPQQNKLKYSQRFNQLDKNRCDYLTGQQMRGVMGESQLPDSILAQIWSFSDSNKDGYLTIERFCVAMFLIDKVKEGFKLPKELPADLQSYMSRSKSESPATPVQEPGVPPPQKTPAPKTFEDKRRDNLDKGEAELQRRRKIHEEEEQRRREEIARKEREEAERLEEERLRIEQQRKAEFERQMEIQRKLDEERAVEEARVRAEREEARKKVEEERMKLMEQRHVQDLENQLLHEKEKTAQIKQRHSTMNFQYQGLEEKAQSLTGEIAEAREEIMAITTEIEGMRKQRDEKIGKIQVLQAKNQEIAVQTERFSHANLQLQSENQRFLSKTREIESLRKAISDRNSQIFDIGKAITEAKQRRENQAKLIEEKRPAYNEGQEKLNKLATVYNDLLHKFLACQQELHQKVVKKRQKEQPTAVQNTAQVSQEIYEMPPDINSFGATANTVASGFGDSFSPNPPPFAQSTTTIQPTQNAFTSPTSPTTKSITHTNSTSKPPIKYRALYEFVARTEDELSLQPGDVILVFEDHIAVGWFPSAFAEPVSKKATTTPKQASITTSPSTEPLESIKEEPTEKESFADFSSAFNASSKVTGEQPHPVLNATLPLYDAPPGNIQTVTTETSSVVEAQGNGSTVPIAYGTASFPWKARDDNELNFARGDKIEIYEMAEMRYRGSVVGTSANKSGWFPKSYVKLTEEGIKKSPSNLSNNKLAIQPSIDSQHSVKSGTERRQSNSTLKSSITGNGTSSNGQWYVAVYDFQAVESTDLSLKIGDRIWVTETKDEWWHGSVEGRSGIFPANYVQRASNTPLSSTAPTEVGIDSGMNNRLARVIAAYQATGDNQLSLNVGDMLHVYNTNETGWSEAEIERNGVKVRGWCPTNYLRLMSAASTPVDGIQLADVAFDYEAQREDELSFKIGDVIEITERTDSQWWRGRVHNTKDTPLLFPSNFVQLRVCDVSAAPLTRTARRYAPENSNLRNQIQELIETEERFGEDLLMVRNVFMKGLINVVGNEGVEKIFLNWDKLIKISKRIHTDLLKHSPGQVFCRRIDILEAFVTFCEGQQASLVYLNQLEKTNSRFRKAYQQCVRDPQSKGMSLSYYLLIPMARLTRYPLIFEKMLKYSDSNDPEYESFHNAYQLLKTLCVRVNQAITEMENKNILCWSQTNIRCDSLNRALEFTSDTRELGPREYIHSGILYKAKGNKMIVSLLYNDFLLLSTPNDTIEDPDSFKISKELGLHLTLYKTPMMIDSLEVDSLSTPQEETSFVLKNKTMQIQLRAPSKNAKSFWIKELQKAIDQYDVRSQLIKAEEDRRRTSFNQVNATPKEIGRLLVEVLNLTQLNTGVNNLLLKLHLDESDEPVHTAQVTIREGQSLYTTQFSLHSIEQKFHLIFFVPMQFRPDVKLGEVTEDIQKIVQIKGQHNAPIIRNLPIKNSEISGNFEVNIKFAIQMFSDF